MDRSSHKRCSVKKVFLEISENSKENTCAKDSFLIKLQAWRLCENVVSVLLQHGIHMDVCRELAGDNFSTDAFSKLYEPYFTQETNLLLFY